MLARSLGAPFLSPSSSFCSFCPFFPFFPFFTFNSGQSTCALLVRHQPRDVGNISWPREEGEEVEGEAAAAMGEEEGAGAACQV